MHSHLAVGIVWGVSELMLIRALRDPIYIFRQRKKYYQNWRFHGALFDCLAIAIAMLAASVLAFLAVFRA